MPHHPCDPELDDLGFAHALSGWIGMTMNFMPMVGESAQNPGLFCGAGYNGHGVARALAVGGLLADRIQGRANEWYDVISRKPAGTRAPRRDKGRAR